jgi:branched-chain amino acid transport system permease protein
VPAAKSQASLIATVGLSLALMEYLRLSGGAVPDWIPPIWTEPWRLARAGTFIVTLTPVTVATSAVGLAAACTLVGAMRFSRFGRQWRAASDDPLAAALLGIDGKRLALATFGISGALAGLAGALVAVQFGALGFAGGFGLGLKALAAAILGGVGSIGGALLGGLAIGLFETLWSAYLPIEGRDLALFVVLVLFIVFRPEGLFGAAVPLKATS